jgi:hypothetical protein
MKFAEPPSITGNRGCGAPEPCFPSRFQELPLNRTWLGEESGMSQTNSEKDVRIGRREIFKLPAMAAAYGMLPRSAAALSAYSGAPMDEADPEGTKIAVKLTVQHTTDEELLFLMGLRSSVLLMGLRLA